MNVEHMTAISTSSTHGTVVNHHVVHGVVVLGCVGGLLQFKARVNDVKHLEAPCHARQ